MSHNFAIATMPLVGHVNPVKPIARVLVARGHRVRWYTGRRFQAAVEATGATFVPMRVAIDHHSANLDDVFPSRVGLIGLDSMRHDLTHVFIEPAPTQVDDLRRLLAREPADALIADLGFSGATMLHELTGVPWVSVGISPLTLPSRDTAPFGLALPPATTDEQRQEYAALYAHLGEQLRDVAVVLEEARAEAGLPRTGGQLFGNVSPLLHLQNGVAEIEYPRRDLPPAVHFVGNLADTAPDRPRPDWWADVTGATVPVVHVTKGTVNDADLDDVVLPTIRALKDEDVLVVAGTGRTPPAAFGGLPANVRAARYVPHAELMKHTAVMVTNGGFGGVQAALSAGVPLVVAAATEDKPEVAARVAWAGAGIDLRTGRPEEGRIRDAVRAVLTERRYAARTARLRAAYARTDAANVSADLLERLVGARQPITVG